MFPQGSSSLVSFFSDLYLLYRDTVNSVGLIPRALPFTTSNTVVNTFRHAVSLDERRAKFKANLWNRPQKHEELLSISDQKIAQEANNKGKSSTSPQHQRETHHMLEGKYSKSRNTPTDVDEVRINFYFEEYFYFKSDDLPPQKKVWFIGCHCGNFISVYLVRFKTSDLLLSPFEKMLAVVLVCIFTLLTIPLVYAN